MAKVRKRRGASGMLFWTNDATHSPQVMVESLSNAAQLQGCGGTVCGMDVMQLPRAGKKLEETLVTYFRADTEGLFEEPRKDLATWDY